MKRLPQVQLFAMLVKKEWVSRIPKKLFLVTYLDKKLLKKVSEQVRISHRD
jgi:hypothetical protein